MFFRLTGVDCVPGLSQKLELAPGWPPLRPQPVKYGAVAVAGGDARVGREAVERHLGGRARLDGDRVRRSPAQAHSDETAVGISVSLISIGVFLRKPCVAAGTVGAVVVRRARQRRRSSGLMAAMMRRPVRLSVVLTFMMAPP